MNRFLKTLCLFVGCLLLCSLESCSDDSNTIDKGTSAYTIANFSPIEAMAGEEITINGSGFDESVDIYFNETKATEYQLRSSNQIVAIVPKDASTGRLCALGDGGYAFSKDVFTYVQGAEITAISPLSGAPGDQISIKGTNFYNLDISEIKVYFNGVEGEVVYASQEQINAIIPEGATTGPVTVVFGTIQKVTGPELVVGEKEPDPFTHYFSHHDVYEIYGKCNPCSYADAEWSELIGEKDKNSSEYKFVYKDGFDESSTVASFVLWDSTAGDYTIFTVDALEDDDYYIYFGTKGKATGNISISVGTDPEKFENEITQEVSASGYSKWYGPYEYGTFPLKVGRNYIKIKFDTGLALNDIRVTNVKADITSGE